MNICLYGASSPEIDPVYLDAAYAFGRLLAQHGHTLVYGGGAQGVMGAAARGAYEAGGKITGIAPTFLQVDGILFDHCTEFLLTDTMAERKTAMIAHADAFVMAPGGFGTLEEFFEVLTLKQLGRHNPAIAVLNTGGFYDSLQSFVRCGAALHPPGLPADLRAAADAGGNAGLSRAIRRGGARCPPSEKYLTSGPAWRSFCAGRDCHFDSFEYFPIRFA